MFLAAFASPQNLKQPREVIRPQGHQDAVGIRRAADVDFLTVGQYLQPTRKHHEVVRFVPPDEFKAYETIAYAKGFLMVSASPLTRSSHHAGEDFARLKAARAAR